jgi:hypothetical protein
VAGVSRALAAADRHDDYPLMCGCCASFLSAEAMARIAAALMFTIAAAQAYGMYDGTYRGNLIGTGNKAPNCTKIASAQMSVTDDKLTYNHLGRITIIATVSSDGSFIGSALAPQGQTLQGRIIGGAIQATTVDSRCSYQLILKQFH